MDRLGRYYGMDGKPVSREEMLVLFGNVDKRTVEKTTLDNGYHVSTVLLCLDHNYLPGGKPLIFETMVFGGGEDNCVERYSTLEEARSGHLAVVNEYKTKDPAPKVQ